MLGRGLSGLVAASQSVALATISDLSTKENKALHLSYVAFIQCLGFVIGPVIGGILAKSTFYTPFLWGAFFAFIAFLWIFFSFEETFVKAVDKKISILRFLKVFVDAYQNRRVRELSIVFLLMQLGVALYMPISLILLTTKFSYTSTLLGLFNGYLGVGFLIGVLFVLPKMLKRLKIEQIVWITLFITFLVQLFSSVFPTQFMLWLLAFPYAIVVQVGFTGMFTSFSNATDKRSQGWIMGISVAIMAIAWAVAGFAAQLVPILGGYLLIFIGAIFLGASTYFMRKYCFHYIS